MVACSKCQQPIAPCVGVPNGFVWPSRDGQEAGTEVEFKQGPLGMTARAIERPVCRACYLEEFARVYPGESLPKLPALVTE